ASSDRLVTPPESGASRGVAYHLHSLEYREAGASPALPRNCERGRNLREATGRTAGKAQGVGRSVSQETCSGIPRRYPFAGKERVSCGDDSLSFPPHSRFLD